MEFDMSTNIQTAAVPGYSAPMEQTRSQERQPPVREAPPLPQERIPADGYSVKVDFADLQTARTSIDEIERTISAANKKIEPLFIEFQYRIHEKTNNVMVSVLNSNTKEVIREIPPEKSLDALAKMMELIGILFDARR